MNQQLTSIVLDGGPFDGHRQSVALSLYEMCRVIALPVNRNILRMLDGQVPSAPRPVRVAALYSRDQDESHHYAFLGFCRPEDVAMDRKEL